METITSYYIGRDVYGNGSHIEIQTLRYSTLEKLMEKYTNKGWSPKDSVYCRTFQERPSGSLGQDIITITKLDVELF